MNMDYEFLIKTMVFQLIMIFWICVGNVKILIELSAESLPTGMRSY